MTAASSLILSAAILIAAPEPTVPYGRGGGEWLIDREGIVAGTTSLHAPSPEPWRRCPVGGGDLSAMVRGRSPAPPLSKSDAWGFQAPPTGRRARGSSTT